MILFQYLVGRNDEREQPTNEEINNMYHEDPLPPYYVDGPNSAYVDMNGSISLLCHYCSTLQSDIYTTYAPEWYIEKKKTSLEMLVRVVILLPVVSPLRDIIEVSTFAVYIHIPQIYLFITFHL